MDEKNRIPDGPLEVFPSEQCADDSLITRRCEQTPDRLSELPDLAIVHILSFLHFEEAARTSVLSKRFYSFWKFVNCLNFSDEVSGKKANQFISFVDAALGFHHRRNIDKFSVKFCYYSRFSKHVDGWIKFATKKQVKVLHLNLVQNRNNAVDIEHKLPMFLYNNQKLVELVTNCCIFTKNKKISLNSLKLLSIASTKLTNRLISKMLSGCPVLEILELRDWSGSDCLKINSVCLRVLRIIGERQPANLDEQTVDGRLLEISGPNLLSLEITGDLYREKIKLMELGSLVSATLDFEIGGLASENASSDVREQEIAREVIENLCFVNTLTVGKWFIKVLSELEEYNLSSPLSERKKLTICSPVTDWKHLGIASLLHSSPHLETLTIRLSCCFYMCGWLHAHVPYNDRNEEYYWTSWSTISRCPLLHLKTIRVMNFRAPCQTIKLFHLLRFLLRNSKVLEEVVIQAPNHVTQEALDEGMKLLSVPTASPDVVVQFEPPHFWFDPSALCKNQLV